MPAIASSVRSSSTIRQLVRGAGPPRFTRNQHGRMSRRVWSARSPAAPGSSRARRGPNPLSVTTWDCPRQRTTGEACGHPRRPVVRAAGRRSGLARWRWPGTRRRSQQGRCPIRGGRARPRAAHRPTRRDRGAAFAAWLAAGEPVARVGLGAACVWWPGDRAVGIEDERVPSSGLASD